MSSQRLRAVGVGKSFGEVVALESADFDLRAGEVMALVGENGAGKSTLVKILCGIYKSDKGNIEIDGKIVHLGTTARAERAGIAVVQQELSVVPTLTVAENLTLGHPAAPKAMSARGRRAAALGPLELVGLDVDPDQLAADLPLAERQMLEIARVVSRDAQVILLDEPTAALADDDIARVHSVVRRLVADNRSVVYITHRLGEVFELADRATVLRDGFSQPPVEVGNIDSDELVERMLGRPLVQMFPAGPAAIGDAVFKVEDLETTGLAEPFSMSVRRGEILGLAGQLGSGTDVLLRGLSGTQPASAARVSFADSAIDITSPARALRTGLAYCSGDRKHDGFFGVRRVVENLTAPGIWRVTPMGFLSSRRERRLARSLSEMVGFDPARIRHRVSTLSGGNQQKVVLGKWLGAQPNVLLIDEPTRGVDVGARAEIYRTLRALSDEGLTVVFASSEMHEILGLADTIISCFRGKMVARYGPGEATHELLIRDITNPASERVATSTV